MSNEPKNQTKRSRHWLRSCILATTGALFIAAFVQVRSHFCWVYIHGWNPAIILATLVWLWLFTLLALRWPGRAILLILTALVPLVVPHPDLRLSPQMYAGFLTERVLLETNEVLAVYRNEHPAGGFPTTAPVMKVPPRVQRLYRFAYTPVRSRPGLPVEDYILTALPTRCCCGLMSFATSRDGKVHFTTEDRRATLNDKIMGAGE
jgi:hypothetical protein